MNEVEEFYENVNPKELEKRFVKARFSNNDRTVLNITWALIHPDTDKEIEMDETIEVRLDANGDPKDPPKQFEEVLKHTTIDQIHENTAIFVREQREQFERYVLDLAKRDGLIFEWESGNVEVYKKIITTLFADFDPIKDKEKLFYLKLQLFEIDQIKKSKDREAKAELRKASNILLAMQKAIEIYTKE